MSRDVHAGAGLDWAWLGHNAAVASLERQVSTFAESHGRPTQGLISVLLDSREEKDNLDSCLVLSTIAFAVVLIGMVAGRAIEKSHPRIFHDVDVSFELSVPVSTRPVLPHSASGQNSQPGLGNRQADPAGADAPAESLAFRPGTVKLTLLAEPDQQPEDDSPIPPDSESELPAPVQENDDVSVLPPEAPASKDDDVGQYQGEGADSSQSENASPVIKNIKAYRQDLLARLAKRCKSGKQYDRMVITLTVSRKGRAVHSAIVTSSGSPKLDMEVLTAAESTEYAPVPIWYRGKELTCELALATR